MLFSDTIDNRALADATISRLKADARMESAKACLFRIGGYSSFAVCLVLGWSVAVLGYTSIKRAQNSSHEIAQILSTAISNVSLRIKGEVELLPRAEVSLRAGQTVTLDDASHVKLSVDGITEAEGSGVRVHPFTNAGRPISGRRVSTSYTVTKEVSYARGTVITSWTFASSRNTAPTSQRCYYVEPNQASTSTVVELALNGQAVSHTRRPQLDTTTAAENCVWFSA